MSTEKIGPECFGGDEYGLTRQESQRIYEQARDAAAQLHAAKRELGAYWCVAEELLADLDGARADLSRVTMERDGARHALEESQRVRIAQSLDLAAARAEVVRLTSELHGAHTRIAALAQIAAGAR